MQHDILPNLTGNALCLRTNSTTQHVQPKSTNGKRHDNEQLTNDERGAEGRRAEMRASVRIYALRRFERRKSEGSASYAGSSSPFVFLPDFFAYVKRE